MLMVAMESASGLGVNWGTNSINPLPPGYVVKMLQANGIKKVKLFDAAYDVVSSMAGTDIEVMVAAPNDMLAALAYQSGAADAWVKQNVTAYNFKGGVNITYELISSHSLCLNLSSLSLLTFFTAFLPRSCPARQSVYNRTCHRITR